VSESSPRRLIRQYRRDLCESEHEHEVEEELERSDPLVALDVRLAHSRTLARKARERDCGSITIAAMAYDEELADRIRELVVGESDLSEKKMFGGLAFLVGGNMAVAASGQGGLLVRVDPVQSEKLVATTNARLMEMRGRSMPGWLRVDSQDVRTKRELARWVGLGTTYARSLPAKR
jgi:TfoX/Sxy family transcriptional regulator of competence genes